MQPVRNIHQIRELLDYHWFPFLGETLNSRLVSLVPVKLVESIMKDSNKNISRIQWTFAWQSWKEGKLCANNRKKSCLNLLKFEGVNFRLSQCLWQKSYQKVENWVTLGLGRMFAHGWGACLEKWTEVCRIMVNDSVDRIVTGFLEAII